MNKTIRKAQLKVLKIFGRCTKSFALLGGTALELYYLKHRFSRDLDLFSPSYDKNEIKKIVAQISSGLKVELKFENELLIRNQAKVQFYTMPVAGSDYPLKLDFVQDVIFESPEIQRFNGIPVYAIEPIYYYKLLTLTGTRLGQSIIGGDLITGRNEIRDMVDVYYLSKKIKPLHLYLKEVSKEQQRGMIQWYRSFSRQEFKLAFLDFEVYDKKLNSTEIILHLEAEIKEFIKETL